MPDFIKNFVDWFKLKVDLDYKKYTPPLFKEKEVWWCRIGENIGTEISGKSNKFTRPVVIYKKFSQHTFLGIPTTTQLNNSNGERRTGTWYKDICLDGKEMLVILNQIRVLDYRRLDKRMATLDEKDFKTIKEGFNALYYKK